MRKTYLFTLTTSFGNRALTRASNCSITLLTSDGLGKVKSVASRLTSRHASLKKEEIQGTKGIGLRVGHGGASEALDLRPSPLHYYLFCVCLFVPRRTPTKIRSPTLAHVLPPRPSPHVPPPTSLPSHVPPLPLCPSAPHPMWTSHEELAWLTDCIPEFRRVQASPNEQILTWLRGLAPRFLAAFPEHSMRDPNDLVKVSRQPP